ncbi:MAG: Shedu anti-phage system protein SduA domain-containing protein, partial [Nostoc sp.]|uniref:Shedu anti-phage system protein SduA domain-containing protein n=1 Tax=Nostoc sp. TaxID=1180 RepID=UPI002FF5016E
MKNKVDFFKKEIKLWVYVNSSTTDEKLHNHLHSLDRKNIQVPLNIRLINSTSVKVKFVELVLKDDLKLNINTDSLSKCKCYVPALDCISDSVNIAATLISEKFETHRKSHTKSVFREVFFQDIDYIWKPLQKQRERLNPLFSVSRSLTKITTTLQKKVTAPNAFNTILQLLTISKEISEIVTNIEEKDDNIRETEAQKLLNILVGVDNLKKILEIWEKNKENSEEEFWHKLLEKHSLILAQIFSVPVTILGSKAYVGGKGIENRGGKVIDFLMVNKLTRNTALIEIKTPKTQLLARSEYRSEVYAISSEISGSVSQLLTSRDFLIKDYDRLVNHSKEYFDVFNPHCIIIAGNTISVIDHGAIANYKKVKPIDIKELEFKRSRHQTN